MKTFLKTLTTLVVGMVLGAATITAAAPNTVQAVVSNFKVFVNGEQQQTKAPIVVDGSTYLPVREVAGLLDVNVNYNETNKSIDLQKKGGQTMDNIDLTKWVSIKELSKTHTISVTAHPHNYESREAHLNIGDVTEVFIIPRSFNSGLVVTSENGVQLLFFNGEEYILKIYADSIFNQ